MRHISAIKKIVADGQFEEAHVAIENLLDLGPKNTEALKLKAALYAHVGRFDDEDIAWRRIIEIDNEDEDAIRYFQGAQLEDREHYYFTDALPGGGRRFLAYPRALVSVSFLGLVGCVAFLMVTRTGNDLFKDSPFLLFAAFLAMVISPWIAIIYLYVKTIRHVSITKDGFEVATRFRTLHYPWKEINSISLAHSDDLESSDLQLVISPRDSAMKAISIDFTEASSAVRARKHLLAEMRDYFPHVKHEPISRLNPDSKAILRF